MRDLKPWLPPSLSETQIQKSKFARLNIFAIKEVPLEELSLLLNKMVVLQLSSAECKITKFSFDSF